MSRPFQIAFLLVLSVLPVWIVTRDFSFQHGFLELPRFGKKLAPRLLPEAKQLAPPIRSEFGYDGQLYAQISLLPLLTDANLQRACPNLRNRARRIGLPMLAYLAGVGRPAWVLQAYSVLNVFFWLALAAGLARFVGFTGIRERLLAVSILWTAGTLISIERALTDLPALTISVWGVLLAESRVLAAGSLLGLAALFKETSVLSFPALAWIDRQHSPRRLAWIVPLLVLPVSIWLLYVHFHTPPRPIGLKNLAIPFFGIWEKLTTCLTRPVHEWIDLIPPLAILAQVTYLAVRPRPGSMWWRWGIGWSVLAIIVGTPIWAEYQGYSRVLLPLATAFNFLIRQHENRRAYAVWFLLGNIPLVSIPLSATPKWFLGICLTWIAVEVWNRHLTTGKAQAFRTPRFNSLPARRKIPA